MSDPVNLPAWTVGFALSTATLVGGYVLRMLAEALQDRRADSREQVARDAARQIAREDREREALLQFAGALAEYAELANRLYMSRYSDYSRTSTWPGLRREETDEAFKSLEARIAIIGIQLADARYQTQLTLMEVGRLGLDGSETLAKADETREECLAAIRELQVLISKRYQELEALGSRG